MHVIGTAGHVDHGKSTLIKALTGIDPDRLREEKERQMTIDLGFAWLELPSGEEIGIVDVPGHRDFIDNMLAGAGGLDAVLFIIAADEGIMPQSREHLAILKLLEIGTGIIVLTKIDLVDDPEWLELVKTDIRQFSAGSFLAEAPIVPVSAVNGTGLQELVGKIDRMIQQSDPKRDIGRARLPVDRIFSIKGFGTVVTGTMLDGVFHVGQQIEVLPAGRTARVRGLQSHKKALQKSEPGSRTAVNLAGIDTEEIQRGDVLAEPGIHEPTRLVDVRYSMIEDASSPLKHNDEVKIFCGTAQAIARVRLIKNRKINPGEAGWMQLELDEEVVLSNGDHFILRRPSPPETIGGGEVLDAHPRRKHKRFAKPVFERFEMLESGSLKDRLINLIQNAQPVSYDELLEKSGLEEKEVHAEIKTMLGDELILVNRLENSLDKQSLICTERAWNRISKEIVVSVEKYHQEFPLRIGITKNELKNALEMETSLMNTYLEGLLLRGQVVQKGGRIAMPAHSVELSGDVEQKAKSVIGEIRKTPYKPPSLSRLREGHGGDLINVMLDNDLLVKTSDDIAFTREDFTEMARKTADFIRQNNSITLSQFRDLFDTSRKYAQSFLEYTDEIGATRFDGDKRTIGDIDKLHP